MARPGPTPPLRGARRPGGRPGLAQAANRPLWPSRPCLPFSAPFWLPPSPRDSRPWRPLRPCRLRLSEFSSRPPWPLGLAFSRLFLPAARVFQSRSCPRVSCWKPALTRETPLAPTAPVARQFARSSLNPLGLAQCRRGKHSLGLSYAWGRKHAFQGLLLPSIPLNQPRLIASHEWFLRDLGLRATPKNETPPASFTLFPESAHKALSTAFAGFLLALFYLFSRPFPTLCRFFFELGAQWVRFAAGRHLFMASQRKGDDFRLGGLSGHGLSVMEK